MMERTRIPPARRWVPWALMLGAVALVLTVVLEAPLQGLLVVGLWLLCPLLMMTMHAGHEHHPTDQAGHNHHEEGSTMDGRSPVGRSHGQGHGAPRR